MHLFKYLPAWPGGGLKRVIRAPKLHALDAGLLSAILEVDMKAIEEYWPLLGLFLESFVFGELLKLSAWSDYGLSFHHFMDKDKNKVDFVICRGADAIAGIDVKASATIRMSDLSGLRKLRDATGPSFKCGVLLYNGKQILSYGDRLFIAPVSVLWT